MTDKKRYLPFRKILVPIVYGCQFTSALAAARLIAAHANPVVSGRGTAGSRTPGRIVLVGLVGVEADQSLSAGAQRARRVRQTLRQLAADDAVRTRIRIRVSHTPWAELQSVITEERPNLMLLEWPSVLEGLKVTPSEALTHPPCDVALVRGPLPADLRRVLVSIRGGPYAELALQLSLVVAKETNASVTALHLVPNESKDTQDEPFQGIRRVLHEVSEVTTYQLVTDDPARTIIEHARASDLVIMGMTARPPESPASLGPVADRVLHECKAAVIAVKTKRVMPAEIADVTAGTRAISVLVDKWFAENTFHAEEFSDLEHLVDLKQKQGSTISLALPALNEEKTVGHVIQTIKTALLERVPLLDEIVLVDSNSTDRTREIAASLGIPVYIHQQVLPAYGARRGKGAALWASLYVTHGDLLAWIDTDIVNIHPRFVYGILGPLLTDPRIQFVKGFYRRPLKVGDKIQAGGGGRVTELTARPLLNLFYPELSGLVQPLSGEYGGRRKALEQLPFFCGYGVEIGLLIDVLEKFGLSAIAQVDLLERIHHNQELEALSKMSFAILQAVFRRLERRYGSPIVEDVNKTMKLIRHSASGYFLDVEQIEEIERPPMIEIPEYHTR